MLATHKKEVLFVGYGNLAKSILNDSFKKRFHVCSINSKNTINFINFKKKYDFKFDIVVLLIKPKIFYEQGDNFLKYVSKETIVISCMAGVKINTITKKMKTNKIIRIMPSILSFYSKSHTCIFSNQLKLSKWTEKNFANLLGTSYIVKKENDINKATALFGSGPAFMAMLIQDYVSASLKLDPQLKKSETILINMFQDVIDCSRHYGGLSSFIESISSKKGTTQEGIAYIKKANINKIMHSALIRTYKRAKELSFEK